MKHVVFDSHALHCHNFDNEFYIFKCHTENFIFFINYNFYLVTMQKCLFSLDYVHEILTHISETKIKKTIPFRLNRGEDPSKVKDLENLSKLKHTEVCYYYSSCAKDYCFTVEYKYLDYEQNNEQLKNKYLEAKSYIENFFKIDNLIRERLLSNLSSLFYHNQDESSDDLIIVKTTNNLIQEIKNQLNN
jgi:hypothetical protein